MTSLPPVLLRAALAIALCVGSGVNDGMAQDFTPAAWLEARLVDPSAGSQSGGRVDIVIERWSSDEESESLRMAWRQGDGDALLGALEEIKARAGVLQFPGHQGLGARARVRRAQSLMFAREIYTPAGRQVIVATGVRLGLGQPNRSRRPTEAEFSLIDIRFGPNGKGVGKVALPPRVTYNEKAKTLELASYDTQSALLIEVTAKR